MTKRHGLDKVVDKQHAVSEVRQAEARHCETEWNTQGNHLRPRWQEARGFQLPIEGEKNKGGSGYGFPPPSPPRSLPKGWSVEHVFKSKDPP